MKKRFFAYSVSCSILLLAALACEKEPVSPGTPELEDGGIKLTFVCPGATKATQAGDDDYNENTLATIDYFLYKEGETDGNAYIHGRVSLDGRTTYNVLVNTSQLNTLFGGASAGAKCDVYAIANYPGEISDASTDIATLKNLAVTTAFKDITVPDNFVMEGTGQATVINKNKTKAAEGTVNLNRTASKVTFECNIVSSVVITNRVKVDDEYIDQEITWVPLLDNSNFGAYLVNGYRNGLVGGDIPEYDDAYNFRYSQRRLLDTDNDGWYSCEPFYSYPQSWHSGDEREPFIKLVVPWGYLNASGQVAGQKQFYYKIPCPGLKMDPNTWYHIKLDVAILGGDDFEAMLEVAGEYYVVPWNTQTIVEADAEIQDARYISAPSQVYNMYNTPDLNVLISSSHDCELNLKSVTSYNFVNKSNTDYTSTALSNGWISYDDATRTFNINHTLNNDVSSSSFDASPYIFTFEIRHEDVNTYTTGDIVVTQYPAMYIEEEESNGYVYVNGTTSSNADNSSAITDDSGNGIGLVVSRNGVKNGTGDNNNTNQYTVHVTTLPADSDYVIGDPRQGTISAVTTLSGLSGYKPAAENTQNVIAPVFKIASSYGKSTALWYDNAKTRCSAYQENGYPAGRWRLPTQAEIEFLVSLSEKGKIPSLFTVARNSLNNNNYISYYWAGGGLGYGPYEVIDFNGRNTYEWNGQSFYFSYTYSGTTTNYHSVYPRCVYDVWYWGDDKDEDHMTSWGGFQTSAD